MAATALAAPLLLALAVLISAVALSCLIARTRQRGRTTGRATRLAITHAAPGVAQLRLLSANAFEWWVARQFQQAGFRVQHTGGRGDHGIDLLIERNGQRAIVQCKRYREHLVQEPVLRDAFGAMHSAHATAAYIVTTHRFSEGALRWANGKPLVLWDAFTLEALAQRAASVGVAPVAPAAPVARCHCGGMRIRSLRRAGWVLACTRFPRCRQAVALEQPH